MVSQKIFTQNAQETFQLGYQCGKRLNKGGIFCLYGELGSGKTTFVQGLASGLGIKKRIISPTFIFIREYKISPKNFKKKNLQWFYHVDLYRAKTEDDVKILGIRSLFEKEDVVIAIEWPEILQNFLPQKRVEIYFKYIDENKREIRLTE